MKDGDCDVLVNDSIAAFEYSKQGLVQINVEGLANAPYAMAVNQAADQSVINRFSLAMQKILYFDLQSELEELIRVEIEEASNHYVQKNSYIKSFIELARVN